MYHKKGKSSTKKHQQTTSSNMPSTIKVNIHSELIPWIQYNRENGSYESHHWSYIAHQGKWILQT